MDQYKEDFKGFTPPATADKSVDQKFEYILKEITLLKEQNKFLVDELRKMKTFVNKLATIANKT